MTPGVFLLMLMAQPVPQAAQKLLFTIERSTNANVVHYDANFVSSGKLDPSRPIVAYWLMLAENGRREELNGIEKRSAYGFTVASDGAPDCYRMTLVVDASREILVCGNNGSPRAEMTIDGHRSLLQRMFVSTKRVAVFWKGVDYVEFFGTDAETGAKRYEKIIPQ